ncbi:hypothetical protein XELAEV_18042343mg [Xenopus laevis]|uniref:Uncharacterized protein n=1 Tax=Xenopus laevis TaxID=8355 RepID=A0A974C3L9_XENLA|nr:hypothetical protein XELAEV_18042343mg [Xenopus laevis]
MSAGSIPFGQMTSNINIMRFLKDKSLIMNSTTIYVINAILIFFFFKHLLARPMLNTEHNEIFKTTMCIIEKTTCLTLLTMGKKSPFSQDGTCATQHLCQKSPVSKSILI